MFIKNVKTVWIVIQNEWLSSVTTPLFWYATCLTPLVFFIIFIVAQWFLYENPKESWLADEHVKSWQAVIENQLDQQNKRIGDVQNYAVLDLSTDIRSKIRSEIERNDQYIFLATILEMNDEEFARFSTQMHEQNDSAGIQQFISILGILRQQSLEIPRVLFLEQVLGKLPQNAKFPTLELSPIVEKFPELWRNHRTVIAATITSLSMNFFHEVISPHDTERSLRSLLDSKQIVGYFVIPPNVGENNVDISFVTLTGSSRNEFLDLVNWYRSVASDVVRKGRLESIGIEPSLRHLLLYQTPIIEGELVVEKSETIEIPKEFHRFIFIGLPFLIFFIYLVSVSRVVTNMFEEKSSKLADNLLANVSSVHLLDGKLWGTAMILLTVMLVWVGLIPLFLVLADSKLLNTITPFIDIIAQPGIVANFALFLFLLYAFYGYFLVALSSLFSTIKNSSSALVMFNVFGVMIFVFVSMGVPFIPIATIRDVISFFPPITPFVMVARSGALPAWPVYITIVAVMLVSVLGVRAMSDRIFERGISDETRISPSVRYEVHTRYKYRSG